MANLVSCVQRLGALRKLIREKPIVRAMECHSGLSALIAEKAKATRKDGTVAEFDALWSSSLTSSTIKAKPDIEVVDTTQRIQIVEDCLEVTTKPMIYDGDTGGLPEIFKFTVQKLERLGVSACIIEDKAGLKQNSLFGTDRQQQLADIAEFSHKLAVGQAAKNNPDFMIIARLEALIAGAGEEEALKRAKAYIEDGKVDGIMIHSKEKKPDEVLSFMEAYSKFANKKPLVVVPTSYNAVTEDELAKYGASVCIHANHLIRAAYPSMVDVAQSILQNGRSKEVEDDDKVMSVKKIISLIEQ
eukprot:g19699.t1